MYDIYMAYSINFQTGVWGEVYIAFVNILSPPPPDQKNQFIYIHIYEWPGVGEV